jgi:hypothetical protein
VTEDVDMAHMFGKFRHFLAGVFAGRQHRGTYSCRVSSILLCFPPDVPASLEE